MLGAFLPNESKQLHKEIGEILGQTITEVFQAESHNFLSLGSISDLRVIRGDNNLDTCYQYAVVDGQADKLLNVKMYDKTLDLIGRDGTQMIGSRLDHVLGSSGQYNAFIKRVCQA